MVLDHKSCYFGAITWKRSLFLVSFSPSIGFHNPELGCSGTRSLLLSLAVKVPDTSVRTEWRSKQSLEESGYGAYIHQMAWMCNLSMNCFVTNFVYSFVRWWQCCVYTLFYSWPNLLAQLKSKGEKDKVNNFVLNKRCSVTPAPDWGCRTGMYIWETARI